jgi:hypothetical protein
MITKTGCSWASQARAPSVLFVLPVLWVLASSCSEDSKDTNDAGDADTDSDTDSDVDTHPELVDCASGEGAYDSASDLCWQDPPSDSEVEWQAAVDYCDGLSLGGADDWRLPTVSELRTLVRGCAATETGGGCWVNDGCLDWGCWNEPCEGCDSSDGPGLEGCYWDPVLAGTCNLWHWSSMSYADDATSAWEVYFYFGVVSTSVKSDSGYARCVRSGA